MYTSPSIKVTTKLKMLNDDQLRLKQLFWREVAL